MPLLTMFFCLNVRAGSTPAPSPIPVSDDWVAPYQKADSAPKVGADDWQCVLSLDQGASCTICTVGETREVAEETLENVVAVWQRDYIQNATSPLKISNITQFVYKSAPGKDVRICGLVQQTPRSTVVSAIAQ
jgi:hypothetical protein